MNLYSLHPGHRPVSPDVNAGRTECKLNNNVFGMKCNPMQEANMESTWRTAATAASTDQAVERNFQNSRGPTSG